MVWKLGLTFLVDKMRHVTQADIDEMRARGYDRSTIAEAESELLLSEVADSLCIMIAKAFEGVKLGDGVGLWEAQGIDDFYSREAAAELRLKDEKDQWQKISFDDLNRCNSSPSFFDAEGFRFHLPAYLIAELKGEYEFDFIPRLLQVPHASCLFIELLTRAQRTAIRECLEFLRDHPDYSLDRARITRAIEWYRD